MSTTSTASQKPARHDPYPQTPPNPAVGIQFTAAGKRRPRLLITPEELVELRARLKNPIEAEMIRRQRERLGKALVETRLPEPGVPMKDREASGWMAPAATLFLATGEREYLDHARRHTLAIVRCDPHNAEHDLAAGQALAAIAYSYDLLYDVWTPAERREIEAFARDFGTAYYSVAQFRYWGSVLLQNHCQVAWTAFGLAGLAFHDVFEEARAWATRAHQVFRTIAWLQPPDGTNMEGASYGAFGIERRLMYNEAALRCLGENIYGPGDANTARWILHMTLPDAKVLHNALPWGDSPRFWDWHGPVHSLLALAKRFRDPVAQGLAMNLWQKRIGESRYLTFLDLYNYDPSVPEQTPRDTPTANHFDDLDLICARSKWEDPNATLVSFLCGPFQGHRAMRVGEGDLGAAHAHADTASLQFYSRGQFLLNDPGYESIKHTDYHNTIIVDGHGQLAEGIKWCNVNRILHFNGHAEVLAYHDDGQAVSWVGDASRAYVREAGLVKFRRHVLYLRPDLLVVVDDLEAKEPRVFTQLWHGETEFKESGGSFGFTQERAALTILPLAIPSPSGAPTIRAGRQMLSDVKEESRKGAGTQWQSELRIDSPRVSKWTFATVIAAGDAPAGPPKLAGEADLPRLRVTLPDRRRVEVEFDIAAAAKAPSMRWL